MRKLVLAGVVCAMATPVAFASGPTLRDKRQAACYDDAARLCGQFFPDEEKVTTCMRPRKAQVSAACRALWDVN